MAVPNIPEIRERGVGEIIDASFKLMFRNFKAVIPFAAWIILPFQLISSAVISSAGPSLADSLKEWSDATKANPGTTIGAPKVTAAQIGALAVAGVLSLLATFVLQAAMTAYVGHLVLDGSVDRKATLRRAIKRSPVMLANALLIGLIAFVVLGAAVLSVVFLKAVGFLIVLPAGVFIFWLVIRFSSSYPPIMLENAGPIAALRRSFFLTRGNFWKVLGALLVGGLITSIASITINSSLTAALSSLGGSNRGFEFLWSAVAGTVSTCLTAPFNAAIGVFLYFDMRVRREGFDLERLANDLGRGALPTLPPPDNRIL